MPLRRDELAAVFVTGSVAVGTTVSQMFPDYGHQITEWIQLIAAPGNTAIVYVGSDATVSSTTGYPLVAGDIMFLTIKDAQLIHLISPGASQRLHYIYV